MSDLFDLTGKVALVTGANTGLGQAIAVGLAGAGADIVAVGRSAPDEDGEDGRGRRAQAHRHRRRPGLHRTDRPRDGRGRADRHPGQQRRHHPAVATPPSSRKRTGTR